MTKPSYKKEEQFKSLAANTNYTVFDLYFEAIMCTVVRTCLLCNSQRKSSTA